MACLPILVLSSSGCVTLGKLPNLSGPQSPHTQNGDSNSPCYTWLLFH